MATTTRPAARKAPTKSRARPGKAAATQPFTVRLPTKLVSTVDDWTKEQRESKAQFVERALRNELREAGANERKPDHALVTSQIPVELRRRLDALLSTMPEQTAGDFIRDAIEQEIQRHSMTDTSRKVTMQGLSAQMLAVSAQLAVDHREISQLRAMAPRVEAIYRATVNPEPVVVTKSSLPKR